MHKKLTLLFICVICFLICVIRGYAEEETLTITTYYPSPYGNYREMRAQRIAIGNDYIQGSTLCWYDDIGCTGPDIDDSSGQPDIDLIVQGNVGIGITNPQARLNIAGTSGEFLHVQRAESGPGEPHLRFRKSRGSLSSPSNVQDNDWLGAITFDGYRDSLAIPWSTSAVIYGAVDGVPSTYVPGRLTFYTGNSTASIAERMRIDSSGSVGIGTTSPGAKLEVNGTVKITDGSQGAGRVLTSNATGSASWQTPGPVAGGLYGYCSVQSGCGGNCLASQAPASCSSSWCSGSCSCPSGYSVVTLSGEGGSGTFTCYKN